MRFRLAIAVASAGWVLLATGGAPAALQSESAVTFSEHVAPIVFRNCTSCHRPGEAAPFSLMNYDDVRRRARLIADVTASRRMPPWKAAPGDYPFVNDRTLSGTEIQTFKSWVDAGMPEGDRDRLPALPQFTEGWQLGRPDLIVSMSDPFSVPAYGRDIYRNFVVPLNLAEDRWVTAVDFRPSARGVVHHSLFFLDDTGAARARDELDPEPGFRGAMGLGGSGFAGNRGGAAARLFGLLAGADPTAEDVASLQRVGGLLGGWALGGQPRHMPDGLAFFVPKGSDLVLSTHFHPSGKPEQEASTVGLYFTDRAPTKAFTAIQLPPLFGILADLRIPAGEKDYRITGSFEVPVDVKAFSVGAHAHYLGREMKLTATLPDGSVKTLLWIPDWDFTWQEQYQFEDYVPLPKGTRLDVSISYDNSADNPRNPNSPPRRVSWGEQSTDEMGGISVQVVAAREEDFVPLQLAYIQHLRDVARTSPVVLRLLQRRNR
jgi:hypothetical protein